MTSRSFHLLSVGLAALLLVAACGGAPAADGGLATLEDGGSGESTTTTAAGTEADSEEAALEFSQCMRDNGVPEFPDPTFTEGGGGIAVGGGGDGEGPGFDPQSEEVQAAFEACGDLLEGAAFGPGGGDFDATELQDNLLAMAECLRDQGLEVDDPDLSNFGPAAGGPPPDDETSVTEDGEGPQQGQGFSIFGDLDMDDPDVQAAMETCQGEFGFTGPGSDAGTEGGEG